MTFRRNRLRKLRIDEISIVDDPCNQEARVEILKAKPKDGVSPIRIAAAVAKAMKEMEPQIADRVLADEFADNPEAEQAVTKTIKEFVMDFEEAIKALEKAEAKIESLEKRLDEAEQIKAERDEAVAELAKMRKEAGLPDPEEEALIKSLPESIRKRLEEADRIAKAAEAEAQRLKDEAERNDAIAKAKKMGVGDHEKVADLMLRIAKGTTTIDDAKMIEDILFAASNAVNASDLFKSIGTGDKAPATPAAKFDALVSEIRKAKPNLTPEQAFVEAMEQNPSLYDEYLAGQS